jgi:hypothetical protein
MSRQSIIDYFIFIESIGYSSNLCYDLKRLGGGELEFLQNTHTPLEVTSPKKKKQWRRFVVRASVDVNVEQSLSAPVDVKQSLTHIMNVSSS